MPDSRDHTVAEQIRSCFEKQSLSASQRRLAQYLLGNYPMAGLGTVAKYAAHAGVSAPTVLRFIDKLGFSGYADFQAKLRAELEEQLRSPLAKARSAKTHPTQGRRGGLLDDFAETAVDNIRTTMAGLSHADFAAASNLLADIKRPVSIIGGRLSGPIAHYLYEHLRTLRPNVHLVCGDDTTKTQALLDMGRRHTLVVFDVRRYESGTMRFAEQAHALNVSIILVTDQWLSPIARFANHIFPVHIETGTTWDSTAAALVLADALIEAVGRESWDTAKKRIERMEKFRSD